MTREILLTNDDSIAASGLLHLVKLLRHYGDITVVAPREPNSARSAALTMDRPLHLDFVKGLEPDGGLGGVRIYTLDGTPCDCAKMGINMFVEEGRMPDMVVSGINHGSNASAAALYSGTLGATMEAALYGIPAIGFSIDTHDEHPDFAVVDEYIDDIMDQFFSNPPAKGIYLNVNFPDISPDQVRGITLACQGRGRWHKEFVRETDPRGREIYWMVGEFLNLASSDPDAMDDHTLMHDGYITIVPHTIDTTDYAELERLSQLWDFEAR
ncbi:MAG: 5'/3'-nucleotidase SurE [Bacteroidales bacterium]|nr:5'/3'-nucleotidase SurE [Bacteroidales bacterium]